MSVRPPSSTHSLAWLVPLGILAAAGCAAMEPRSAGHLDAALADTPRAKAAPATYTAVLRANNGKMRKVVLPWTSETTVQTAVEQSGAARKFDNMTIVVERQPSPQAASTHRMDSGYDPAKNRVPAHLDYALHPNDSVLIADDPITLADQLVDAILAPMGGLLGLN
jgi:predicted membrane-bound mannosyltransferase